MTTAWTAERILALAPDPASAKAGQGLANARKWVTLGQNERALWGECQGSGANPYQTQIDLSEPAFKCTCPSRKFPCKHGLALFLLLGPNVSAAKGAPPEWVTKWLATRAEKQQAKKEKAEKPAEAVDPVAQAKRAAERWAKMQAGIEDLRTWMFDTVRNGFASIGAGGRYFEAPAARLVDAQAPGAARLVRELGALHGAGDGWPLRMLEGMAGLFLMTEAFGRMEALPPETQADVRSQLGIPVREEEVLMAAAVRDNWQVLGQRVEEEERLRTQRTWLSGETTGRLALVLEFSHMGQPLKSTLVTGTQFCADMVFYPSGFPMRAIVKERFSDTVPLVAHTAQPSVLEALAGYGRAIARHPWLERYPMQLDRVTPNRHDGGWFAQDAEGNGLPLTPRYSHAWELVAIAGGGPVALFGEFDGQALRPLSVIERGTFHALG